MSSFMFATGIENSIPTIEGGKHRVDQYEKCGHYTNWQTDFDLVEASGCRWLRYGTPLHTTHVGRHRYDWSFADETFNDLKRRGITPIMDLCHFGLPDWLGDFQNEDFPFHFAAYAKAFAERYPWVRHYTPVNEMFICAMFSAFHGWWNEQLSGHRPFVTAVRNITMANRLAMEAILRVRPDAVFIQAESCEYFHSHPAHADAAPHAEFFNDIRFLTLDLNYGRDLHPRMRNFLLANGASEEELRWYRDCRIPRQNLVLGVDYYWTNERYTFGDASTASAGDVLGLAAISKQYWARYGLPLMHTETNRHCERGVEDVTWLYKQWANWMSLRDEGIPVCGFTWYSLHDQVDWDCALRQNNGNVNPLGLYGLDRKQRNVGAAYAEIIQKWEPVLNARIARAA